MAETAAGEHRALAHGRANTLGAVWAQAMRSGRLWLLAAAAILLVSPAAWWLAHRDSPLRYEAFGGLVEDNVISSFAEPALIEFSDESWIELRKETQLDLSVLGHSSALARVWHGRVHVSVEHRPGTNWRFLAGPYEVLVVGTEFELAWDPKQARLRLDMVEGKVRVVGPSVAGGRVRIERLLETGQTLELHVDAPAAPVKVSKTTTSETKKAAPGTAEVALGIDSPSRRGSAVGLNKGRAHKISDRALRAKVKTSQDRSVPPVARQAESETWASLVKKGEFGKVVSAAQDRGIDVALQTSPGSELKALAQAAGYRGKGGLARRAWKQLRIRFRGQAIATQAAFFLGRIEERAGASATADRLFETYLAGAPHGVYAGEALGRRVSIAGRAGPSSKSRGLSRLYLKRYPRGAYAKLAQGELQTSSD